MMTFELINEGIGSRAFNEEESADNSENNNMSALMSMSSVTSSASSNSQSLDAQIDELKSPIYFSNLPQSLKRFRIKLAIMFVVLLITAIVLLVVNVQSKNSFVVDINALKTEKVCRNSFSNTKMALLYLYAYINKPNMFDIGLLNVSVPFGDFGKFAISKLKESNDNLHQSLA